jgi:hypothetical protein
MSKTPEGMCEHWKDYCEPDIGLGEWCRKENRSCTCSGVLKQCEMLK